MNYNSSGNSPPENEGDFIGMGEWGAHRGRTAASGIYSSTTVPRSSTGTLGPSDMRQSNPNDTPYRSAHSNYVQSPYFHGHAVNMYDRASAQDTQPRTAPHPQLGAGLKRSYANVVSQGQQPRARPRPQYTASAPDPNLEPSTRTTQQPSTFSTGPARSNPFPYQLEQDRSWAQVAATPANQPLARKPTPARHQMLSPTQMMHPSQAYNDSTNATSFNQSPFQQLYFQTPMGRIPHNSYISNQFLNETWFGSSQNDPPNGDSWKFDRNSDFDLFDNPITRFLDEDQPFVVTSTLVIDPTATLSPPQTLKSPVDSIDASSATSSVRRSKREIMEGMSGEFKCQHCGAGFRTQDDRRHHENRVHMPNSARPYSCSQCDKRFLHEKDLKRHLPIHGDRADNAKYFCHYAGCRYTVEGFARRDHYNRHMATHYKADSGIQMSRSTSARTFS